MYAPSQKLWIPISAVVMLFCDPIAGPYIFRSLCWSPDYDTFVVKLEYILFNKGDKTVRDLLSVTRTVGADTVTVLKGKCHCSIHSELFHKLGIPYRNQCTSLTLNNAWPQQKHRKAGVLQTTRHSIPEGRCEVERNGSSPVWTAMELLRNACVP